MRVPAIFLAAVLAITSLTACANKEEGVKSPNTLTTASIGDAERLIPMLATDTASSDISGLVFNGLTKYDKDIKITGDLAESWDVSKDGLVITFHLRKGVKWHDGAPFTSADVLFTYEKVTDPKVPTPYSENYGPVDKVEAPDEFTVRVTYKEPYAPALENWGMGIIPKHLLEGKDLFSDKFNRNPVGTGPYRFTEWITGQRIVLTAFDDYFEHRPNIDRYITRVIPDRATMFLELKSRGIDFMGLSPIQYARQTNGEEFTRSFNKLRYPAFAYTYLGYNLKDSKFSDRKVRQALSYAIDKQAIIDGVLLGLGTPCTGPFPPESWAFNPDVKGYPYDPERAKAMLAEAGWTDTDGDGYVDKDGEKFSFTILTNQGNDERKKSAEIIQQDLKKVGIEVKINVLEWQALLHNFIDKRKFEAIIIGWSLSRDPDLYEIWHSSKTEEGDFNFASYKNPEVDRLIMEGRRTFDLEERKRIYRRVHELISEDAPYTFLYVPDALPVLHKRFKGVKKEPLGIFYNFIDWYVPKDRTEWYQ